MLLGQHGSSEYLPRGRGRSPLSWSLIENRKRLVWNLFQIQEGIDNGPIVESMVFDINEWDNIKTLYYKVSIAVKRMVLSTLQNIIKGQDITYTQQVGEPSYYRKITPQDRLIDWNLSIYQICNSIKITIFV